jgi:hypothetical protein
VDVREKPIVLKNDSMVWHVPEGPTMFKSLGVHSQGINIIHNTADPMTMHWDTCNAWQNWLSSGIVYGLMAALNLKRIMDLTEVRTFE